MKPSKLTPTIGMEIHVELATNSKMFCGCPADHFSKKPNTQTCPVCLGLPGALPVPNKKAIDWTIMLGAALGCTINKDSKFDRKHYFYPDLPKGYQISQYDEPFCVNGLLKTSAGQIGITRVHLEEDTGKLLHRNIPSPFAKGGARGGSQRVSLIDFNRSGVPLVEIVSEPDIHSSAQAKEYAKNLTRIVRFLKISDADMEKGSMRLEANISLGLNLGYKVEVKNINSFRFLQKAIDFELVRQTNILNSGKTPAQETRGFNETKGVTFSQRSKEEAQDYRYFPEPDIPPIQLTANYINKLKSRLPKLPSRFRKNWHRAYKLKAQYYDVLLATPDIATYADKAFYLATKSNLDPNKVAGAIVNKKITTSKLKPSALIKQLQKDSSKVTNQSQIKAWINQAIKQNSQAIKDYQSGKQSALGFLVGQVMQLSKGQADPKKVNHLLRKILK